MASPRFPQTDTKTPLSNTPTPQPQYEQIDITKPIPEYTVTQTLTPQGTKKRNSINSSNANRLEHWLNNLKPGFYQYLADKQFEAATSNVRLADHLYAYLTMYQGEIVGEYLSEGSMEMLFSALGPIGNLWRSAYHKNISWKMAWMMNPLNPDSLYFYLRSLPERQVFKIALLPIEGAMAILAKGGGPFTQATYQDYYGHTQQKLIFTPLLRATQAAHIAADGIDKLAGFSTNTFDPTPPQEKKTWNEDNSPWKQDMNQTHQGLHNALVKLKEAKKANNKTDVAKAHQQINKLLNKYYGSIFQNGSIFRGLLGNTARRLRSTERDPISYFLSLIGGAIWDLTLGLALNTAKTVVSQAINLIPGIRVLRAQFTEFMTGDKFLSNTYIGGSTIKSFVQGVFSPVTLSSGYLGAQVASYFFPNSPMVVAWTTGITGGLGAFYNVALKIATRTNNYSWIKNYEYYKNAGVAGEGMIQKNYFKGFKPGPFSNFAKVLAEHPFARLPINGLALGNLLSPYMQAQFGWNPWFTHGIFAGADWLLQTRHEWAKLLTRDSFYIEAKSFKFLGKSYELFGHTYYTPYFRILSLNNPNSLGFKLYQKYLNVFYTNTDNVMFSSGIAERPWFSWTKKNILSPAQPYIRNFFNPGFFMGIGLIPYLTPAMGAWAYLAGPVAGSAAWMLGTRALASISGIPYAEFVAKFNPLAWSGFMISQLSGLLFFGTSIPFWYTAAWTIGMPIIGMSFNLIASMAGTSVINLFAMIIDGLTSGLISTLSATAFAAQAMVVWATAFSVGLVAGLTIFFAYTIYAGFWVPMIEEGTAQPTSTNFSINTTCSLTTPNQYNCCSNFSLTENVFNDLSYLKHETDIGSTDLFIDLTDPSLTTDAFRNSTSLLFEPGGFSVFGSMNANPTNNLYTITNNTSFITGHDAIPGLITLLSVPTEQPQNLFELMQTNSSVVYSMQPFFDILTKLAEEYGQTQHLIDEYKAQLDLMKEQKKLVDDLIPLIEDSKLLEASASATGYLNHEPMGNDPCPDPAQSCPEEKQGLKNLYDSWSITVNNYISTINIYLNQTDPDLQPFLDSLEQELKGLEQQIDLLPDIINQMEDIQRKINSQADADAILAANFSNFANMTPDGPEQLAAWALLKKYFPDVFNETRTFYFIPSGTNYQVCVDTQYTGPIPATPQTVCSTISYTPSVWGPNTAFAKACTTFTPQ